MLFLGLTTSIGLLIEKYRVINRLATMISIMIPMSAEKVKIWNQLNQ